MIKHLFFLALILYYSYPAFSQSSGSAEPLLPTAKAISAEVELLGNRYLELGRFSGSILIEDGSTYYLRHFGKADYELDLPFENTTAFKVGSLTEFFTRAIFAELEKSGRISADEKVSRFLPKVEKDLSLRSLLNHESGLQTMEEIREKHPETEYTAENFTNLSAVTKTQKSDLNYNLLGRVLEVVSGKTYSELVAELAKKYELENTFFDDHNATGLAHGYTYSYRENEVVVEASEEYKVREAFSSKGIKTTATDLLKILKNLPEENLRMDGYLQNDGFSYGVLKDNKRNIIVLSNRRHPVAGEIIEAINAILDTRKYDPPLRRKEIEVEIELLGDYAGSYALNPEMQLQILAENDSLFVKMGPQKVHLKPQSKEQFFMAERDSAIRFLKDPSGEVIAAELLDGFLTGNKIEKVQ